MLRGKTYTFYFPNKNFSTSRVSFSVTQNSSGPGDPMSPFIVRCTCLEMDTRGKSHIQNERKAPQDPYHGLSFTGGGGGGCTELTVHGPFTHSTSVLDDICQQALVLNSCGRRLIMPCVEWLVFFRVFFFLTRCGRPPA